MDGRQAPGSGVCRAPGRRAGPCRKRVQPGQSGHRNPTSRLGTDRIPERETQTYGGYGRGAEKAPCPTRQPDGGGGMELCAGTGQPQGWQLGSDGHSAARRFSAALRQRPWPDALPRQEGRPGSVPRVPSNTLVMPRPRTPTAPSQELPLQVTRAPSTDNAAPLPLEPTPTGIGARAWPTP